MTTTTIDEGTQAAPDGESLYKEAAKLQKDGDMEGCRAKLKAAAETGYPDAVFSYGAAMLTGAGGDINREEGLKLLQDAAQTVPNARQLLALAHALGWSGDGTWQDGIAMRVTHAEEGDVHALTELGLLLLLKDPSGETALPFLEKAAAKGHGDAMAASLRYWALTGKRAPQATLRGSALQGMRHPLWPDLAVGLARVKEPADWEERDPDFDAARDLLAELPLEAPVEPDIFSERPEAHTIAGALPIPVCEYVFTRHFPAFKTAQIKEPKTGALAPHPYRRSLYGTLSLNHHDLVLHAVEQRLAALANVPWSHAERLVLLAYRKDEEYKAHYDYLEPDDGGPASEELERAGQRVATVMTLIRDGFEGGETAFVEVGKHWRGKMGEALVLRNLMDDNTPDPSTLHAGEPVTKGLKVMASLWLREKPVPKSQDGGTLAAEPSRVTTGPQGAEGPETDDQDAEDQDDTGKGTTDKSED